MAISPRKFIKRYSNFKPKTYEQYLRIQQRINEQISAVQKIATVSVRERLTNMLNSLKIKPTKSAKKYMHYKGKVFSSNEAGIYSGLYLDLFSFIRNINNNIIMDKEVQDNMYKILSEARANAPVDKRYIGYYKNGNKIDYKSKQTHLIQYNLQLPAFGGEKSFEKTGKSSRQLRDLHNSNKRYRNT